MEVGQYTNVLDNRFSGQMFEAMRYLILRSGARNFIQAVHTIKFLSDN